MSIGIIYGSLAWSEGEPAAERAFFRQEISRPLVIAHRGGAGLYPENTLHAFKGSSDLGVDVIELDVRGTADGTLVVIHDATVDRTTNGSGRISEMTLEAVKKLNAGYRFSPDGGKTFPFRESGVTVPTLPEVFAALPDARFNIEIKQETPSLVKPVCGLIRERKMSEKVVVASFRQSVLDDFRRECSEVATSAGPSEVSQFLAMYKTGLGASYSPAMQALQVPEYLTGLQVISKEFVENAQRLNLKVHVWTINETTDMQRLLGMGVHGIMTDYPDRLLNLLDPSIIIKKEGN
ncbi:MAG TPA: glycerophosphodiester phosphodiesterase [Pyrinomonadaceae bacterium]|nr:glycerophosphodiester phosphodiesterase [Pyrinomonadaceae bacterium]